ncbi:MAG: hypothetical protein LBT48_00370 [Prevotellaceae bacterium]|jgi:hypothetical protein|nr:hypothetical protein [Prevotellaceae bacterium]
MKFFTYLIMGMTLLPACTGVCPDTDASGASLLTTRAAIVAQTLDSLRAHHAAVDEARALKGIRQAASLWTAQDGSADEFAAFCTANYVGDDAAREALFRRMSDKLELIFGYFHRIDVGLTAPLQEAAGGDIQKIDLDMGSYNVSAHFNDDMFRSKAAFTVMLNFPSFTLAEKQRLGGQWSRLEWGYARLGDCFTARIPAQAAQAASDAATAAETYIADYNIAMGALRNEAGEQLFADGMTLIAHWGLRDELKSNYADDVRGLEKQRLIYRVMTRIVAQEIPAVVINNGSVAWRPVSNTVYDGENEVAAAAEPDTRYRIFIDNFKAARAADRYTPDVPTAVQRAFDGGMEFSKDEIDAMFTALVSSPQVKQAAALIAQRLGRALEPFDIWYDGFKSRSSISEDALTAQTRARYPDAKALERDLPNLLRRLGFVDVEARRLSSKIQVDAARGAGHAWGAVMKGDKARLRTRVPASGMDYKGYNIAVHEFGHNVEQTISLYDVDYYVLNGVPNTAFTEALAFVFQKRDLELLGMKENSPDKQALETLDIFWGCYEIMGVALVDVAVWEWLYAHPDATPAQLKESTLRIARDVWNAYYAPVLGGVDSPILSIYSHMLSNPLYLSNYPLGHLIEFQLEAHFRGKSLAGEIFRIYKLGRLTPQLWMTQATGQEVSIEPMLNAVDAAVVQLTK